MIPLPLVYSPWRRRQGLVERPLNVGEERRRSAAPGGRRGTLSQATVDAVASPPCRERSTAYYCWWRAQRRQMAFATPTSSRRGCACGFTRCAFARRPLVCPRAGRPSARPRHRRFSLHAAFNLPPHRQIIPSYDAPVSPSCDVGGPGGPEGAHGRRAGRRGPGRDAAHATAEALHNWPPGVCVILGPGRRRGEFTCSTERRRQTAHWRTDPCAA